jgi:hypothetical protein
VGFDSQYIENLPPAEREVFLSMYDDEQSRENPPEGKPAQTIGSPIRIQ